MTVHVCITTTAMVHPGDLTMGYNNIHVYVQHNQSADVCLVAWGTMCSLLYIKNGIFTGPVIFQDFS